MSTTSEAIKNAPAVAAPPKEPKTFPGMLEAYKAQIAVALPKHLTADRMARIALTEYRKNPKLGQCTPVSVFAAVIMSAQLGLELGIQGQAYLVPYFDNRKGQYICQFIPGWRGLVDLAQRSGRATCWTGAVFDGDEFEFEYGTNPFVRHVPHGENDPEKLLFTYAVGRVRGAEFPQIEVWPNEKTVKHFKRFNKVGDKHYAHQHWEMYARKVPLLQVLKYLPQSIELSTGIQLDHAAASGEPKLNIEDAIAGTFTHLEAPEDEGGGGEGGEKPPTQTDAVKDQIRGGAKAAADKSDGKPAAERAPQQREF